MADDDPFINALMRSYDGDPSTADVRAKMPAPQWGGLKSHMPDQPEWMRTAQQYAARGLSAVPPEVAFVLNFLGRGASPRAAPSPASNALGEQPIPSWRTQADELGARAAGRAGAMEAEVPAQAAYMFGDKMFTGPHHFAAQDKAYSSLGEGIADGLLSSGRVKDGFVTNRGRFVTRKEASLLMGDRLQGGPGYTSEEAWDRLLNR